MRAVDSTWKSGSPAHSRRPLPIHGHRNLAGKHNPRVQIEDCAARSCAKASAQKSLNWPCAVGVFRSQAANAYGFRRIIGAPGIFIVGLLLQ